MNTPMRWMSYGLVTSLGLWGVINIVRAENAQVGRKDASFIKEAAEGNLAEIQMGKMGMDHGVNAQIKDLAKRLQQDHTKANQELMQIAQKDGVTLPSTLNRKESHMENKLEGKTGADFDKAFARAALKDHEKDIKKYEKALQSTADPQLKAFIQKSLPILREHLQLARSAGSAVGLDESTLAKADRFLNSKASQSEGLGTAPASQSGAGSSGNSSSK